MHRTDFLVIGGGIVGLSIARDLRRRFSDARVTLLEKEAGCGRHASGRNSGVLHAGFYYSPDSLKARFTKAGNRQLTSYCLEKKINLNLCGKLVVAKDASDLPALDELLRRGQCNGIELQVLSAEEAKQIQPRVRTHRRALFSPTTSTVDPGAVIQAMVADAEAESVEIRRGVRVLGVSGRTVRTTESPYEAGYVVNAAGLYADRLAKRFGFSERYRILPFKGLYLYSDEPVGSLRANVYPVPDLRNPFLGVHFTVTSEGRAKIGPTAIPAFWREQYGGAAGFALAELAEIAIRGLGLLGHAGFEFRRLAFEEITKYSRRRMVALAGQLMENVRLEHFTKWGEPGIRAQLLDIRTRRLEMDFVLEGDDRSMHVLNAVSPGFTCAMPFAEHVGETIQAAVRGHSVCLA